MEWPGRFGGPDPKRSCGWGAVDFCELPASLTLTFRPCPPVTMSKRSWAVVEVAAINVVSTAGGAKGEMALRDGETTSGLLGVKMGALGLMGVARGGEGNIAGVMGLAGDIEALSYTVSRMNVKDGCHSYRGFQTISSSRSSSSMA